jgi:hypothetical protein
VLACGDIPERRWLAGGLGLWSSPDGETWTEQPGCLSAAVAGVAAAGGRVWIATDIGLAPVWMGAEGPNAGRALPPFDPSPPRPRPRAPSLWSSSWGWPTVTTAVAVDASSRRPASWARRSVTAFVLLRFPLDRVRARGGDAAALALERARRDAELARLDLAAEAASATATAPADLEELAAWRELAADEREALR